jgi:predicted DNA binding CopG/RHH family protein
VIRVDNVIQTLYVCSDVVMKQDFLQIRIDKELLELVRQTAAEEDTPVSRYVREALREKLDRNTKPSTVNFSDHQSVTSVNDI